MYFDYSVSLVRTKLTDYREGMEKDFTSTIVISIDWSF